MALRKQKVTRKQLLKKPDEFIALSSKMVRFALGRRKELLIAAYIILGVVVLWVGIRYFTQRSERKAQALFEQAYAQSMASGFRFADGNLYEGVTRDLDTVLVDYRGTAAGPLAAVVYAELSYRKGDYDRAILLYESARNDFGEQPLVKGLVICGLGFAYLAKQDYGNAVRHFEALASGAEGPWRQEAMLQLATLYTAQGDKAEGAEAWRKLADAYPNSLYHRLAKEKLAQS